jgi:hypothetical protein
LSGERVERRLAAILAADVAGYSRLMGQDETGTLARLRAHRRELIEPKIAAVIEPTLETSEIRRSERRPTNDLGAYNFTFELCRYCSRSRRKSGASKPSDCSIRRPGAIHITDRHSPWPRLVTPGSTIGAKNVRRTGRGALIVLAKRSKVPATIPASLRLRRLLCPFSARI